MFKKKTERERERVPTWVTGVAYKVHSYHHRRITFKNKVWNFYFILIFAAQVTTEDHLTKTSDSQLRFDC